MRITAIALAVLAFPATAQTRYESPVWAPDGRDLVFVMKLPGGEWNLVRSTIDGSHRVALTRDGAWDPAWAPDGKSIAFVSTIDGKRQVSLVAPDGGPSRQLTRGPAEHFHPAWSPDGRRIACASAENGSSRIVLMNSDGSAARPVTPDNDRARWPAWSPDGKSIAYYVEAATSSIWVADLVAATQTKLFDSALTRTWLDWSPDGKELVFTRGAGKTLGIDVLEIRSRRLRRVLGGELGPGEPRWSPDGTSILFSTQSPPGIAVLKIADSTVARMIN